MDQQAKNQVTQFLERATQGERSAVRQLLPLVYDELRGLAGGYFQQQQQSHTLQPTALVHEAFIKVMGASDVRWENRAHFFAVAATAMRQILTDCARRKNAIKRGGGNQRVTLSGLHAAQSAQEFDLLSLDEALTKLAAVDQRQAEIVEKRFLGGLTVDEVAFVMGVSASTVEREWRMARAWLRRELSDDPPS